MRVRHDIRRGIVVSIVSGRPFLFCRQARTSLSMPIYLKAPLDPIQYNRLITYHTMEKKNSWNLLSDDLAECPALAEVRAKHLGNSLDISP